ncbi:hypothetical protein [Kordiimonas sp.]|uniref:hypothetical protein n=1 Tax=Kordiimonas sp. TaxID=1970157 RepID=UPI003A8E7DB3
MSGVQGSFGARRHRVTLMAEQSSAGAGARLIRSTPIIADVWAEVETVALGVAERADAQAISGKATFRTAYKSSYKAARLAEWRGVRYRLENFRLEGVDRRTIAFDGVSIQ